MSVSRNTVSVAIFKLLTTEQCVQWVTKDRRLVLWTDVALDQRPAMFLVEHHEVYGRQSQNLGKKTMEFNIFIYLNTTKSETWASGGDQLNDVMDKIDLALAPSGKDKLNGRDNNTLGGLVSGCYIDGQVLKVPGDLEGDGLIVIPIKVLLP